MSFLTPLYILGALAVGALLLCSLGQTPGDQPKSGDGGQSVVAKSTIPEELEALNRQSFLHRAQAVGPFRMSRRREVVEAGLVGEEERVHQVGLTGNGLSTSLGASGAKTQRKTQSMRLSGNGKGWFRASPFALDQLTRRIRVGGNGPIGPCALKKANSASAS